MTKLILLCHNVGDEAFYKCALYSCIRCLKSTGTKSKMDRVLLRALFRLWNGLFYDDSR